MKKIRLLSEEYLKNNSTINLNVETQLFNSAIDEAQRIKIEPILGTKLYTKILNIVDDGSITGPLNTNYKTLLDEYILNSLLYWSQFEVLPFIRYKIVNKGIQSQTSDNSAPIELNELKYLTDIVGNKAKYYDGRLIDYLCANNNLFPEYHTNVLSDLTPSKSTYFCGLQLDNNRFVKDEGLGKNSYSL